ncbi:MULTISPECIES: TolC family outer membrane protein [Vitreoscilla]|uniref:TolC family outer membrane protein n=1 Tax=Vitreoscilla stercoraria TaxID=61 RepID=A0ABY4E7J9_VITST|nr:MULTISPECIES: TolC family outer membrane protein [Vitreoscilla]AUZ04546.1 type I secretion outer membrane protein TolC [Vitreoscilla sp. C1]UOO91747.1 TolC family outer membrane protein [Vitreoscilla stercoraria]
MKSLFYTGLFLLSLHTPAWAFDLQDAWNAALNHDAGHTANAYARQAAQEQTTQARAYLLPYASLGANYQRNKPLEPNADSYSQHGYSVQATQTLFDAGKLADYRQSKIAVRLADTQFDLSEQQLLLDVSQTYFDVLTAHDMIAATNASKASYQRQLDQAKTMFDVGAATIVDTHEAQAGLDAAQVQWLNAQHKLSVAQEKLRHLTGLNPEDIQVLQAGKVAQILPLHTLAYWQEQAQANSSNIAAKALAVEQAQETIKKAYAQMYPKIELQAAYQDQHQQASAATLGQATHNRGASIGVQLSMPLYAGGGISSYRRQVESELLQRKEELLAAKREIELQVRERYLNVQNGLAQVKALEQLLLSNRKKLESSQLGQQVGVRSNLDVVMAQQTYADAEQQLAAARYQYLQAQLALAQSAGQLQSGATLAHINQAISQQTLRKQP